MLEGIKQKTPSLTSIVGMMVAVVVVLLAYGAWQVLEPSLSMRINKLNSADLSGRVIYSGVPQTSDIAAPKTYSLNLTNNEMQVVNESERFDIYSSSAVEFSTADNDKDFFFRALAVSDSAGTSTVVKRVVHAVVPERLGTLAEESLDQYGTMSWSENGKLLARGVLMENVPEAEKTSTENWQVVLTDEGGEVKLEIPDAANPVWMPNSNVLLFLRSDGIYAYDMSVEREVRIISFLGQNKQPFSSVIGIMFEVSPDGRRLILTTPGTGNISVYEVSPTLDVTKLYSHENQSVNYSWPVVSPDGMSYAVIARDIADGKLINPRIEFYTMDDASFTMISSHSLNEYDPSQVYLDDWIK